MLIMCQLFPIVVANTTTSSFDYFSSLSNIKLPDYMIQLKKQMVNQMGVVLIAFMMIWAGVATAQNDCTATLISMSPCLSFVASNSLLQSSGCCTQLSTVVDKTPECLCQFLNGGDSNLGIIVDTTKTFALTTACKVVAPNTCTGRGSNAAPSSKGRSNDATSTNMATPLSLFSFLIASYATIIRMV